MPFTPEIAARIARSLMDRNVEFEEKKMFGGLAFMIRDKMCIGVLHEDIMLRVMETHYPDLLEERHVRPMNFTGTPMKGFLFIEPAGFASDRDLNRWIDYAWEFALHGVVKSKKKK